MNGNARTIQVLRQQIPTFTCEPGCHDCCGPVTASSEELLMLPVKSDAEHAAALAEWNCPYLIAQGGEQGCTVYAERPLICRLFGTTPRLACPRGRGPAVPIDPRIEQRIYRYWLATRQVLV